MMIVARSRRRSVLCARGLGVRREHVIAFLYYSGSSFGAAKGKTKTALP